MNLDIAVFINNLEKQQEKEKEGKKEASSSQDLAVEFLWDVLIDKNRKMLEWRVASETEEGEWYVVRGDLDEDDFECNCPDFRYKGRRCKHIEAVRRKVFPSSSSSSHAENKGPGDKKNE